MKTFFTILICAVAIMLMPAIARADDHEFRYKAPDATSVELMCEHNGWTLQLREQQPRGLIAWVEQAAPA